MHLGRHRGHFLGAREKFAQLYLKSESDDSHRHASYGQHYEKAVVLTD
jgi:hypothetical protein